MQTTVQYYTAFSTDPARGNPAGLVLDGDRYTDVQKQEIARRVGLNETAFVCSPTLDAHIHLRYFTPGHEMPLCGHATVATLYALKISGVLPDWHEGEILSLETRAGILPMRFELHDGVYTIVMAQSSARFVSFEGSVTRLAASIGLTTADIDTRFPIVYGSTGTWTLLVPIRSLSAFGRMQPDNVRFPEILTEMPRVSVHPFCLETTDSAAHMHARHFSSAYSGTVEDPVTGTASGVMGAYYLQYVQPQQQIELVIEQGFEMGRDGRVLVRAAWQADEIEVSIAGSAAYMKTGEVEI